MSRLEHLVREASAALSRAIRDYKPRYVVALFSGGHDSLVATHIASRTKGFSFACHIDTGIGIPETRRFVETFCENTSIPIRQYRAADYKSPDGTPRPQLYRTFVLDHGFPGPAMHTKMYNRLKERPLRQMIRDLERSKIDKVLLVSGLRASESARRGRHSSAVQVWEGTKVWIAPIWSFTKLDVNDYIATAKLPRNLVVDLLHKSGECLCGAFARPGEKEEVRLWFPKVAAEIDNLEVEVRQRGFDWGWGQRPRRSSQNGAKGAQAILCSSCAHSKQR